jgi:O-antigen/teichoic acid export membrane protein
VNTSQILARVLKYTGILAIVLAVVGGVLGYVLAGSDGLVSVLLGTAVAIVFAAITAISLMIAIKFEIAAFFGIVMGSWLLKMVLFIAAILLLRDQPFINDVALFVALVVAIVGTVVIDAYVVMTSRMGYVSDVSLPSKPETDDAV